MGDKYVTSAACAASTYRSDVPETDDKAWFIGKHVKDVIWK